jgi:hypothetical protein
MKNRRVPIAAFIVAATLGLMNGLAAAADSTGSAQATSSVVLGEEQDGAKTLEITNVTFDANATAVPGRPPGERLLLRKTTKSREVMGDMGVEATVTIDAWPLGTDLTAKPLYSVTLEGLDAVVEDYAVLVFDRGTEEVDWWSVYQLGTGEPLFDSYVPVLHFSLSREIQTIRYVGFEVPPDDASNPKLREPHVVGLLAYASADEVIHRLLLTCSDANRATELRSFADTMRTLSLEEKGDTAAEPAQTLHLRWSAFFPSAPNPTTASIPIAGDDLDAAHAHLPACMKVQAWAP